MILQVLLVVVIAALLFPRIRRLLKTTFGMVLGAFVLFLIVVAISQQM